MTKLIPLVDIFKVDELDDESGYFLSEWIQDNDSIYGYYQENDLIAYCMISDMFEVNNAIEQHPLYVSSDTSLYLTDVFVMPEHRHNGIASKLIAEAITLCLNGEKYPVFLDVTATSSQSYYEKLGFTPINEQSMVKIP